MTPQEKDLIQSVFDRLAAGPTAGKDVEADSFIRSQMQRLPDAAYGLVQAVVMQEAGLAQAQARIADLQSQLDRARAGNVPAGGGSFLGGASPWGGGSVPRSAPMSQPMAQPGPQPAWPSPQPASPWAQSSGGGGFLRNAATMAAGVAGGTLIAEGLSSLLGGHHYGSGFGGGAFGGNLGGGFGGPTDLVEQVTVNNYYDGQSPQPSSDGFSRDDASYDSGDSFDGGYDDSTDI